MGDPSTSPQASPRASGAEENVSLEPIRAVDRPVLDNLFELYAHDFSELVALELRPSGRFEVRAGDTWWSDADHHPLFIRVGGRLAGFALAARGSRVSDRTDVMDVAEFFVVRGERRRRVGQRAALALLRSFGGAWEIRVRAANASALSFWQRVGEAYTGRTVKPRPLTAADIAWNVLELAL